MNRVRLRMTMWGVKKKNFFDAINVFWIRYTNGKCHKQGKHLKEVYRARQKTLFLFHFQIFASFAQSSFFDWYCLTILQCQNGFLKIQSEDSVHSPPIDSGERHIRKRLWHDSIEKSQLKKYSESSRFVYVLYVAKINMMSVFWAKLIGFYMNWIQL